MKWRFDPEVLIETDPSFRLKVDRWVREAWSNEGQDWGEFLRRLPGVFPLDAWASVIRQGLPANLLRTTPTSAFSSSAATTDAEAEHPSDFEWRFSPAAAQYLIEQVDACAKSNKPEVACLGCPTLFTLGITQNPSWSWQLIDQRLITGGASGSDVVRHDLRYPLTDSGKRDVVVLDPPWYNYITRCFLSNAMRILKPGGHILLSMPGVGTRPSAEDDQAEIKNWAKKIGLEIMDVIRASLIYRSPFFETSAFSAAGFDPLIKEWRRGDLFVFKQVSEKNVFPSVPVPEDNTTRQEYRFGPLKIVTLSVDQPTEGIFLLPIWKEEVIPSVSARFQGRESANVITSGNRFFRCGDIEAFRRALSEVASGQTEKAPETSAHFRELIEKLLQVEAAEFRRHMDNENWD